jgi:hypothetical protein
LPTENAKAIFRQLGMPKNKFGVIWGLRNQAPAVP